MLRVKSVIACSTKATILENENGDIKCQDWIRSVNQDYRKSNTKSGGADYAIYQKTLLKIQNHVQKNLNALKITNRITVSLTSILIKAKLSLGDK